MVSLGLRVAVEDSPIEVYALQIIVCTTGFLTYS